MNVDYASCYLPQWVHMYIYMHTSAHTCILNEYVCPAEGQGGKMNSSVVVHTVPLSLPVKAESSSTERWEEKKEVAGKKLRDVISSL